MSELSFPMVEVDAAALEATHNLVRMTLPGYAQASYSLILPKGWITEEDLGQQNDGIGQLMRIGMFADKVGRDAMVEFSHAISFLLVAEKGIGENQAPARSVGILSNILRQLRGIVICSRIAACLFAVVRLSRWP
jgi:hypothetical protein